MGPERFKRTACHAGLAWVQRRQPGRLRGWITSASATSSRSLAGADAAAMVRIQYGGSVTAGTSQALLGAENVDGFLVGRAGLDTEQFGTVVIG